jgi:hypothetical protein
MGQLDSTCRAPPRRPARRVGTPGYQIGYTDMRRVVLVPGLFRSTSLEYVLVN